MTTALIGIGTLALSTILYVGGPQTATSAPDDTADTQERLTAEDHRILALRCETDARHHEAVARQLYEQAISIDPLTDRDGDRHRELMTAAASHHLEAGKSQIRAKRHRAQADNMRSHSWRPMSHTHRLMTTAWPGSIYLKCGGIPADDGPLKAGAGAGQRTSM